MEQGNDLIYELMVITGRHPLDMLAYPFSDPCESHADTYTSCPTLKASRRTTFLIARCLRLLLSAYTKFIGTYKPEHQRTPRLRIRSYVIVAAWLVAIRGVYHII